MVPENIHTHPMEGHWKGQGVVSTANYIRESLRVNGYSRGVGSNEETFCGGGIDIFLYHTFLDPKGQKPSSHASHGKFGRHERSISVARNCQLVLLTCSIGLWRMLTCTDFDWANLLAML